MKFVRIYKGITGHHAIALLVLVYECIDNILRICKYIHIMCIPTLTCQRRRARTARTCWSWPRPCQTSCACPVPARTVAGTPAER